MKNNSVLFYMCSLIEFIGRQRKLKRAELVKLLGEKTIEHINGLRMYFTVNRLKNCRGRYNGCNGNLSCLCGQI